jgi:hypothetical protein
VHSNRAHIRTVAAIIAVTLATLLLAACGKGDENTADTDAAEVEPTAVPSDLQDQIDELGAPDRYAGIPPASGTPQNSYSSISPRSANARVSVTPPTQRPSPGCCLSR